MPAIAETDAEIESCFDVMSHLRPHLQRTVFLPQVRQMQKEGYRLAYLQKEGKVVAVAGYRISTSFHMGKHLYVNDLVTSPELRSRGYGEELLYWLRDKAIAAGCGFIDLDSGTQRGRAQILFRTRLYHCELSLQRAARHGPVKTRCRHAPHPASRCSSSSPSSLILRVRVLRPQPSRRAASCLRPPVYSSAVSIMMVSNSGSA